MVEPIKSYQAIIPQKLEKTEKVSKKVDWKKILTNALFKGLNDMLNQCNKLHEEGKKYREDLTQGIEK